MENLEDPVPDLLAPKIRAAMDPKIIIMASPKMEDSWFYQLWQKTHRNDWVTICVFPGCSFNRTGKHDCDKTIYCCVKPPRYVLTPVKRAIRRFLSLFR